MENEQLREALDRIQANADWRKRFVQGIISLEKEIATPGRDVRSEITGPLVDAVFVEGEVVRKTLADGTRFDFLYRSKIARDFVMCDPEVPDHAWEPQTTRLLVDLARGVRNAVVGGAYFGDHTILIAKEMAKVDGTVHAFEPDPDQLRMLMHNARLNGLENIVPQALGLWDAVSERLKLVGYDSFAHSELAASDSEEETFLTTTVDAYLSSADIRDLGLIMLDIEGAEARALAGADSFLAQPPDRAPRVVFEVHRHYVDWSHGLEQTDVVRLLEGHGYHVFAVRDFNSNVQLASHKIEIIPVRDVYLDGPPHGFNMVAVKDPAIFSESRYRICRNVSPKLLRHKDPALHHPSEGL